MADPRLERWLDYATKDHSPGKLLRLLAEDAVFHSPVVHTPQEGRERAAVYLSAADHVFADSGFHFVRTIVEGDEAMLEFAAEIDGIHVNGIDIIRWNQAGEIEDFKVMVRPLRAINKLWEMMATQLEEAAG